MNTASTGTQDVQGLKNELARTRAALKQAAVAVQKLQAERNQLRNVHVIRALFHRMFYDSRAWSHTRWLGTPAQKCPLDLWMYQEIVCELRPTLIVECGTGRGGTALFLAAICDLIDCGQVLTIDVHSNPNRPQHDRVRYLTGSSTDEETVRQVADAAENEPRVMVILDSDHREANVARELELYHRVVTAGSYLIVEGTNINGHPVLPSHGPGPMEALAKFLKQHSEFYVDGERERFLLTFNPHGYLRKMS